MGDDMIMTTEEVVEDAEEVTVEENTSEETGQAEQTEEKVYTESDFHKAVNDEVNRQVGARVARKEARLRKDYEERYGELETVLRAGTGRDSVEEITNGLRDYYKGKNIDIPDRREPAYSERDLEVLAKAEAKDIIAAGFDEVVEETERLANIDLHKMTPRQKAVFKELSEYRKAEEQTQELLAMGVKRDVIDSAEFKEFVSVLNPNLPATKAYELYAKQNAKPVEKIGSMKNADTKEEKTFYTSEEVDRLTPAELDDPKIMKRVRESMFKWK